MITSPNNTITIASTITIITITKDACTYRYQGLVQVVYSYSMALEL
jgi:hypothetical protein